MDVVVMVLVVGGILVAIGWLLGKWVRLPMVWRGDDRFTSQLGWNAIFLIHDRSYLTGLVALTGAYAAVIAVVVEDSLFGWAVAGEACLICLQWIVNAFNRPGFLIPPPHRGGPGTLGQRRERRAALAELTGFPAHITVRDQMLSIDATSLIVSCRRCGWKQHSTVQSLEPALTLLRVKAGDHMCPRDRQTPRGRRAMRRRRARK